jgi:hypothetical protein
MQMLKKLFRMLRRPDEFFEGVREEGGKFPFIFFLQGSAIIAIFAPIANFLG